MEAMRALTAVPAASPPVEAPPSGSVRYLRVYATPYAYTPNGAPLYVEYGGEHAQRAASAVRALRRAPVPTVCASGKRALGNSDDVACATPRKKSRLVWTDALHASFVRAVHALGIDAAVPKQIMRLMAVRSLTRENVASHLQKYRAAVRRAARDRERTRERVRARSMPRAALFSAARASPLELVLNHTSVPEGAPALPPPQALPPAQSHAPQQSPPHAPPHALPHALPLFPDVGKIALPPPLDRSYHCSTLPECGPSPIAIMAPLGLTPPPPVVDNRAVYLPRIEWGVTGGAQLAPLNRD